VADLRLLREHAAAAIRNLAAAVEADYDRDRVEDALVDVDLSIAALRDGHLNTFALDMDFRTHK
jgi:hypothetical protein